MLIRLIYRTKQEESRLKTQLSLNGSFNGNDYNTINATTVGSLSTEGTTEFPMDLTTLLTPKDAITDSATDLTTESVTTELPGTTETVKRVARELISLASTQRPSSLNGVCLY